MSVATEKTRYTPEDLLALPDEKNFELVDGRLVERNMGALSSWVGGRLYRMIDVYCEAHAVGLAWPADNGFQCFPDDPAKVRKPDVAFIRSGRLPGDMPPQGFVRIAPDLAVEVISPNDLAVELEQKLAEYRDAGVSLVWVVNPGTRTVRVHRGDGTSAFLTDKDELSGDSVLPGFRCRVADLFPVARPTEPAAPMVG